MYLYPERWQGEHCLQRFNEEQIETITMMLDTAAMEAQLHWVAPVVDNVCKAAVRQAQPQCPPISLDTAWDVFCLLLPEVRNALEEYMNED